MATTRTAPATRPGGFLGDVVDLERYPILEPDTARFSEMVAAIREDLESVGCSVIRGFLRPETVRQLQREGRELAPRAHINNTVSNAYSTRDDPSLPEDHPVRLFMERTNAFVPKASIPEESALRRLYHEPTFKELVARCMGEDVVHEYADPFAGLVINVLGSGCQHPWHYDTNEFIVSTLIEGAEDGGVFEYCPNIRSPRWENYGAVGEVIRGEDRSPVRELVLRAGDLQLFKGRFALHRVTRVRGRRDRLSGIFAYAKEPGVMGKVERTRQLFGTVTEAHGDAERTQRRDDGLTD